MNNVANLISGIRVCLKNKIFENKTPYNKFCYNIMLFLQRKNIVSNVRITEHYGKKYVAYSLNQHNYTPYICAIAGFYATSKQMYLKHEDLKTIMREYANLVVSTNQGLMDYEECMKNKIGGRLILAYK